ncbi:unnamed protein product [Ixodes pacificus]
MGSCGDLDFLQSNVSAAVFLAQFPRDSRRRRPAERSGPRGRKPGSDGRFGLSSRSRTPGPPPSPARRSRKGGRASEPRRLWRRRALSPITTTVMDPERKDGGPGGAGSGPWVLIERGRV